MNAAPGAVAESFSRAAARYDAHADVQEGMAAWLAAWLPEERGGRALEIGAGTGGFTRHLADWRGRLVATDLSAAMCAAGRARSPRWEWRTMDAAVPLAGPWDWIFSSSMLQWATQPEGMLRAWREVLAADGRILAGLFVAGTLPELAAALGEAAPLQWQTAAAWNGMIRRAGLRIVRSESKRQEFSHPNAAALLRSLHGVGAAPERKLSAGALRRLLADYDTRHRTPEGVSASWTFFRFEAARA